MSYSSKQKAAEAHCHQHWQPSLVEMSGVKRGRQSLRRCPQAMDRPPTVKVSLTTLIWFLPLVQCPPSWHRGGKGQARSPQQGSPQAAQGENLRFFSNAKQNPAFSILSSVLWRRYYGCPLMFWKDNFWWRQPKLQIWYQNYGQHSCLTKKKSGIFIFLFGEDSLDLATHCFGNNALTFVS